MKTNMMRRPDRPRLRFSPTAWAKLIMLRDAGETEVGGFGITPADDLLLVEDVKLVAQECTEASVAFDDESVADFFDRLVDQGFKPQQFARIWLHTHPGDCPTPSGTDEETFARVFGRTDWAVMFIIAQGGRTYARLQFRAGPGGSIRLPVRVDYERAFGGSEHNAWAAEYDANVTVESLPLVVERGTRFGYDPCDLFDAEERDEWGRAWDEYLGNRSSRTNEGDECHV